MADDGIPPVSHLLTLGGDERITIDPTTHRNRYHARPMPGADLAYASTTANDISPEAYAYLSEAAAPILDQGLDPAGYEAGLARLREVIADAYRLDEDCQIVFAPSGTDLEYVALASVLPRQGHEGICNVLLAPDEVGSGCILSAAGRYFAGSTALEIATTPDKPVAGLGRVKLRNASIRSPRGRPLASADLASALALMAYSELGDGMLMLIHILHGSKTGLILPSLKDIDALRAQFGERLQFVVDACQARITPREVNAYLERGMAVLMSGSKFMGGPPFSGFALVPGSRMATAAPLPAGFANIFRRAEWPQGWPGRDILHAGTNAGLLLRLEAALFELRRFAALPAPRVDRVVRAFQSAARAMIDEIGAGVVEGSDRWADSGSGHGSGSGPDRGMALAGTMITADLSRMPERFDLADSQYIHARLVDGGVRLGQPVKCVPMDSGWGGTLRIALSMPQVVTFDALSDEALIQRLGTDMTRIGDAILTAAADAEDRRSLALAG